MKVLVVGANGKTGKLIVEQLAKSGEHEPYAMIRNPKQEEDMKQIGGHPVLADLEEDVSSAVQQAEAIIFAAGSGSKTGPDKTISVDQEGAKRVIDSAKAHGIQHFVMLSSMGTDNPEQGPDSMQHYFRAKAIADEYLQNSELSYTIVRPGRLTDDKGNGKIQASHHLNKSGSIPREDVAAVLIASLTKNETKNKSFEILSGNEEINDALKFVY
ncbi:SDR family oxidoreductase [Metabacillus arenae]|uniref:SDR family oxidoreductase n=1 Tax=Metabacillus arenae TaxID=2771434 RepID=A0A926RWX8_9BACI|nr:SDR family oxidoreductase [Metabacillus arenae]MBD1380401.1 SDR family oxidoreductase [Metabacillus arenae]